MNKNKKLIPEFRFPEFNSEGEWRYKNGDELFEPVSNKNHNSDMSILAITQEQGAIPREMIDYHVSVTDKSVESYKVVEVGDFIISLRSFQGGIEYSNYLGLCSPAYIILRKKIDVVNDFYRFYFKSIPFIRDLNKNLEGIRDGKMVSYKQFSEISIPNPETKEQQKIASCLSSLEEVIAAHVQKLDLLKAHKKGLMQNLFPQEGETLPKYRFKEFENDRDWAEKILSEVANYENGKAHEQDISENGEFVVVNSKFISTDGEVAKYSNKAFCLAEKGDILMVLSDVPNGRAIAKCFYVYEENKYTVNQRICKLTSFDCDSLFIFHLMNRNSYFLSFDDGVKQTNLRNVDVQNFPFLIPNNIKEQQKIASCLSSLDALITEQAEKIEQLKLYKKGLMQGLFPKTID